MHPAISTTVIPQLSNVTANEHIAIKKNGMTSKTAQIRNEEARIDESVAPIRVPLGIEPLHVWQRQRVDLQRLAAVFDQRLQANVKRDRLDFAIVANEYADRLRQCTAHT